MTNNPKMISADQQRRVIPYWAQVLFEDTTDEGLMGLQRDPGLSSELRMFARLEVEYRSAYNIMVDHDRQGGLRRRSFTSEAEALVILDANAVEDAAIAESAADARARWSTAAELVREDWAAMVEGEEHVTEGPVQWAL